MTASSNAKYLAQKLGHKVLHKGGKKGQKEGREKGIPPTGEKQKIVIEVPESAL